MAPFYVSSYRYEKHKITR